MLLFYASPWMVGTWYLPEPTPSVKDINGVVLAVGDTVMIRGIVTSIVQATFYTGNVSVDPNYYTGQAVIAISSLGTAKV